MRVFQAATVRAPGVPDALLVWFDLELLPGVVISTLGGPAGTRGHWGQVALVPRVQQQQPKRKKEGEEDVVEAVVGGKLELYLEVRRDAAWLDGGWRRH